ncbi:hypothetical protein KFL_002310060 [Klebsormidium nitens]|uniref:Uncharacterized protein n=1 Tax=Klebsormidium nitens TaxID=105231 RepID=A0A1Y1I7E8_KLENI|nr:hypothetical protein KFL_002310060 [Klebsormidium nitens]|eukprot:GAQ85349.1 hypothetical protein KFL_002310060 [Klebsormidium nitens]
MGEGVTASQLDAPDLMGQVSSASSMRASELSQQASETTSVGQTSRATTARSAKHVQIATLPDSSGDNLTNESAGRRRSIPEGSSSATSLPGQPSPEERIRLLMDAYSPRKSLSARSARFSPRPLDSSRKRNSAPANAAAQGMLAKETSKVVSTYSQMVTKLAAIYNDERKIAEGKEKERQHLVETLRDLEASSITPATLQGSPEQATIVELRERVGTLASEVEEASKISRMCEHMVERIRLSAQRKELKIKHLKVLHDRVATDRDQAELNMHRAQDERLAAENKVFDLEADLEDSQTRNQQALAGLRRVVEKREEMLLQRSLWENRVQADIDAIQRAERERDLRTKLVINSFHSVKAHVSHQSAKEKAEDYEERLRKVEQSTGLHIDLRNVGDVVDLVMRQRKLKDLQVDKVRGEARREALAEELRELHAVVWSLANVPERSSKMLDEFTGPMRRAEARAERAARDVETHTTLALKLKSWLRNLMEKLATVDMLVGNDRRNSQPDSVPAPAGPPVHLTMADADLIKAVETLENRLYRCLLIASAPTDAGGDTGRDPRTPRMARQSVFPTPIASPRSNAPTSPRNAQKTPMLSPMASFARRFDKLLESSQSGGSDDTNQPSSLDASVRSSLRSTGSLAASITGPLLSSSTGSLFASTTGSLLGSILEGIVSSVDDGKEATREASEPSVPGPAEADRKTESTGKIAPTSGKLRATLRPKLAAVTTLLRPKTATTRGSLSATTRVNGTPRAAAGRPPPPPGKTSQPQTPRLASSRTTPDGLETHTQTQPITPSPVQTARALRTGLMSARPRVTLEVNLLGSETTGRTPRDGDAPAGGTRRRPASAHPLLQAATTQLQTLKPEQLEALVLGQSTPRDVALDLLSRPGGNNWRLDQKIRNLRECFMTGPNAEDANDSENRAAMARSRSARRSAVMKSREKTLLDDEVVLEREDIKQQSAKIMDLLRVAEKKWEDDERRAQESERDRVEAAALNGKDRTAQMLNRLARPKKLSRS